MDAGALDVLHDAGDQDLLAVADRVDFDLLAHQVLVDQDRVLRLNSTCVREVARSSSAVWTISIARPPST